MSTQEFMQIIRIWWNISNVKSRNNDLDKKIEFCQVTSRPKSPEEEEHGSIDDPFPDMPPGGSRPQNRNAVSRSIAVSWGIRGGDTPNVCQPFQHDAARKLARTNDEKGFVRQTHHCRGEQSANNYLMFTEHFNMVFPDNWQELMMAMGSFDRLIIVAVNRVLVIIYCNLVS
ncbi:hypothetical protein DMENIID0001_041940 [Sergentomyia squamirostris]